MWHPVVNKWRDQTGIAHLLNKSGSAACGAKAFAFGMGFADPQEAGANKCKRCERIEMPKRKRKAMTAEEFVQAGADVCPFCGKGEVEGDSLEVSKDEAWQECYCNKCGKEWRAIYHLAGYNDGKKDRAIQKGIDLAKRVEFLEEALKRIIAWIQCDPEGNGPGFLNIDDETIDDET